MEIVTLKTKPPVRKDKRSINASITFDLPNLIEKMKHEFTWTNGDLNAMILLKRPDKKIVLAILHEGTEIRSFQSDDSVTFQIIEGRLRFHTQKESVTLNKGQLLTLHENIKYSFSTGEETAFLLTIANAALQPGEN
jgi:quercetin dioxygenase-like cupin family protein